MNDAANTNDSVNDPELLAAFFAETNETLEKVASLFVELERSPGDLPIVEAIFRPVHSLKGNSAFFGFMGIKRLAHDMETVLDHVRKSRLVATPAIISTLLSGLDGLTAMVERLMGGGAEIDDPATLDALIARQREAAGGAESGGADPLRQAVSSVEAWLTRQGSALDVGVSGALNALLLKVRSDLGIAVAATQAQLPELVPTLLELRALTAASFKADPDASAVARMAVLVGGLPALAGDERGRGIAAELLDAWRTCIDAAGFNEILRDFLAQQIELLATMPGFLQSAAPVPAPSAPSALEAKKEVRTDTVRKGEGKGDAKTEAKSVHVPEARIDTFLRYVGELLVVGDMFNHLQARVRALGNTGPLARDFRRVNDTFAVLSTKLQGAIMSIRKVPIRPQLTKVPRIVRDVALAKGKEIAVEFRGEDIEIDKSLVELIDAPLTHMTRNAADHGIETPAQRLAAGKPREGRVLVAIEETSRAVVMTISDDGAGLNLERIRAKGESLGLVKPGAELVEQDLINLIFASGLSTAEVVSDVSGRGVGMDVVKRMIDEGGGTIQISTKTGHGTEFRLTLPKGVTTQIVPAFLVRTGKNLVALPLERVRETFLKRGADITTLPGMYGQSAGQFLQRHDETLPLLSLATLLEIQGCGDEQTIISVDRQGGRIALLVSEVIGVRKIVVRPLNGLPAADGLYLGGAMMGDGAVALIVNPDALLLPESTRAG